MKKIHYYLIATIVLAGLNVWTWQFTLKLDYQLAWISFLLVWIDLVIAWIVYSKSETILYLFFTCAFILEALLLVNNFWIQRLAAV